MLSALSLNMVSVFVAHQQEVSKMQQLYVSKGRNFVLSALIFQKVHVVLEGSRVLESFNGAILKACVAAGEALTFLIQQEQGKL